MKRISIIISLLVIIMQTSFKAQINLIPKPQEIKYLEGSFVVESAVNISSTSINDKLTQYVKNYFKSVYNIDFLEDNQKGSQLISLNIDKDLNSNTGSYKLKITPKAIAVSSSTEPGLFYGIQTLFQLLPKQISNSKPIEIPACEITDYPRFSWRGLNLDCSRHFMTKDFIKRYIDILAYYKFNTLHWHLTDDQGWRIEIKKYPKLTEVGAWRKEADGSIYGGYYTQEDIQEIAAYAQSRFINIVPEIEMPGHSIASLASYPENSCTGGPFDVTTIWGVHKDIYCAGRDSTFYFLQDIIDEVVKIFPGKYIHIGGDEAPKDRWKECPRCQLRIKAEGLKNEEELQSYFIKRISNYINSRGKEVIGWDEILQGGLAPGAIVQSWQSFQGAIDAAKLGHYVVCSPASHTYLNSDPENLDLRTAYSFNPIPDELSESEKKYILGSEANLWTERAPQESVDQKLFPRILALSEVFWSNSENRDFDDFHSRIEKAYPDLNARGIKYGAESKAIIFSTSYNDIKKEFTVKAEPGQKDLAIRYTMEGDTPGPGSSLYTAPINISKTVNLKMAAFRNYYPVGKEINLSFALHKALNAKIVLTNKYDERYRGGGDKGLVDGIRGTTDLHDGLWQGFEGVDFEGVIELKKEEEISDVSPRFLLDANSWIFLPGQVEVSISEDGINYTDKKVAINDVPQKNSELVLKDFSVNFTKQKAKFIKVKAVSIKKCPPWHPGAGGKAWLFIDEIEVE